MPSKYKRDPGSRKYKYFSDESVHKAMDSVIRTKMSIRKAAEKYNITKSTLQRKLKGENLNPHGGQTALSVEEESVLVQGILETANWGFPLQKYDVRLLVKCYLDRIGQTERRFKSNMPGVDWVRTFLKRHQGELTVRLAENVKRSRAAVSSETIKEYFENLEITMEGVPPKNVVNYDETNVTDDPGRVKVLVKHGCKHPERLIDSSKASVSVMMAASGAGDVLPPYVVYKAEHLYENWTMNGPPKAHYNRTKSGWFDMNIFEDWFMKIALPYFRTMEGPKVLLGDNLSSHVSLKVIQECAKHGIRFCLLPPNCTHLCQPLDVAFFRPLKIAWRNTLDQWKKRNRGCVQKEVFPSLLKETLHRIETTSKANVVAGFCATGIVPLNREKVLKKLPDYGPNLNDSQDAWNKSFETILENVRFPDKGKGRTTRGGKRIQVAPGKSVCIEPELDSNMDTETEDLVSEDSSEWSAEVEGGGSRNSGEESASNIEKTPNAGSSLKELQNGDFYPCQVLHNWDKETRASVCGTNSVYRYNVLQFNEGPF
jgi:hypothetical protein